MVRCEVLEQGEEALVYGYNGRVKFIQGPKRLWLFLSKLTRLEKFTASHDEYLKISYLDGKVEHRQGPCTLALNSLLYSGIKVEKCFYISANQAIVVYERQKETEYSRKIIYGPGIFINGPDEWVHTFSWHGEDPTNKTVFIANNNKFVVLNFAPDQIYYNVDQIRTFDDALIRIKLMIFFELTDIEKMLNETKDPIADILNCCSSDITSFTSKKTYSNFIENCHELNDLSIYTKLVERSKKIGFEISKVVFRGYYASPKLQTMHDRSMQTRTQLQLEFESTQQFQEQQEINLINETLRLKTEQELELSKLQSQLELDRLKHMNQLKSEFEEKSKKIEYEKELAFKNIENTRIQNEQEIYHLKKLHELNINLTDFLIGNIQKTDKLVKIVNNSGDKDDRGASFANIHFHE